MDIWKAAGRWYVNRSGQEFGFDSETEARNFMNSEKPIELELAERITGELLPNLRKLLATLMEMKVAWEDNDMDKIVEQATKNRQAVAGFGPETWSLWGTTFGLFWEWLETPHEKLNGMKPRVVLMKRYTQET